MDKYSRYVKSRATSSDFYAAKRGAYGQIPPKDILLRLELQDHKCFYCKGDIALYSAELDHVRSIISGGEHYMYNIVLTCRPCNRLKSAKSLRAFCARIGRDLDELRQEWAELNAKQHALTDFDDEYRPDSTLPRPPKYY